MFAICNIIQGTLSPIQNKEIPSWSVILPQLLFFLWMEDFTLYWSHRALHTKWLYAKIHKVHHEYKAPWSCLALYSHPLEIIFGNVLPSISGPILIQSHIMVSMLWFAIRIIITLDVHSGYSFPWSLEHWLPIYAGPHHHGTHHEKFIGNYSSSLVYLDWLLGTRTQDYADRRPKEN